MNKAEMPLVRYFSSKLGNKVYKAIQRYIRV